MLFAMSNIGEQPQPARGGLKLVWTVHCEKVHDALLIAAEQRAAGGSRVILRPSSSRTAAATEWMVEVQTAITEAPPQEDLNRKQARIETTIDRWEGVRFLGWNILVDRCGRPSESRVLRMQPAEPLRRGPDAIPDNCTDPGGLDP